nr:MAG TPA: hypothetical protein [Caudoviricetes sp.]
MVFQVKHCKCFVLIRRKFSHCYMLLSFQSALAGACNGSIAQCRQFNKKEGM